jgi:signal peptidase I
MSYSHTPPNSQPSNAGAADLFLGLNSDLLRNGRSVRFSAPGHSMYPTIRDGETLIVQPIEPARVAVGDIILHAVDQRLIAHRVVRIVNSKSAAACEFIFKADASSSLNEPVKPSQILGKVVSIERNGTTIDPYGLKAKLACLPRLIFNHLKHALYKS